MTCRLCTGNFSTASYQGVPLSIFVEEMHLRVSFHVMNALETSCSTELQEFSLSFLKGFIFYFRHDWFQVRYATSFLNLRFIDYLNTNLVKPERGSFLNDRFQNFACLRF
jgi:hypothetical protein